MSASDPEVCVFGSSLFLTISIEPSRRGGDGAGDELHFHPGGQGFWIARMLNHLGCRPVLVAPVGGEAGDVLRALVRSWGITLRAVPVNEASPAYVHDRRSGARDEIAQSRLPCLDRHEIDDLYGNVLSAAASTRSCVVTGRFPGDPLPIDFYRRLGADLGVVGTPAVGDLHGVELDAFLAGGPLHTLKVSDEDLRQDGLMSAKPSLAERITAVRTLQARGVERVVLSAAEGPSVMACNEGVFQAVPPFLETVDHRGSGDSMTAGLAMAQLRGLDATATMALACAAGAANATRHGLGNADAELVRSLADRVEVAQWMEPKS